MKIILKNAWKEDEKKKGFEIDCYEFLYGFFWQMRSKILLRNRYTSIKLYQKNPAFLYLKLSIL
jgi:hypothetical protein